MNSSAVIIANVSGQSAGFRYNALSNWENHPTFNAIDKIASVSLLSSSIPITYPSIHPWFNNNIIRVRHFVAGVPQTPVDIDLYTGMPKIISGPTLASVFQTKLNQTYAPLGMNFVVAYDAVYQNIGITQTVAGFQFSFPIPAFTTRAQEVAYTKVLNSLGLSWLAVDIAATAAFDATGVGKDNAPVPASTTLNTCPIDLIPIKYIQLNISEIPGNSTSSTSSNIACFQIPVSSPYGFYNVANEKETFVGEIGTNPECAKFGNSRITLTTTDGELIPFQGGVVNFVLQIKTHRYSSNKRSRVETQ